jgi:hypothetical protein
MTSNGKSRMNRYLLILACLLIVVGCSEERADDNAPPEPKQLADIRLDPAIFGEGWQSSAGVILECWDDLSKLPVGAREVLTPLRSQAEPAGVIALADFSCVRKVFPLNSVTVRVFKFKDSELASAWGEKKYQYSGWEQHYTTVEGVSYFAVDSTQLKKRCVVSGDYWITSHHLGDDELHIKALEIIMQELGLALQ